MKTKRFFFLLFVLASLLAGANRASAFYNPETGRWLNKDPLEEQGGFNLYAFVVNNPLLYVDAMGFSKESILEKLTEAEKTMQGKCFCCDHDGEAKCKTETTKIVTALKSVINDHYGKGEFVGKGSDEVGGYLCWDWANAFNNSINGLGLTEWTSTVQAFEKDDQRKNVKNRDEVHFTAKLHIGKVSSPDMCVVYIDDSWPGGNGEVLHQWPWPKGEFGMHPFVPDPNKWTPTPTPPAIW